MLVYLSANTLNEVLSSVCCWLEALLEVVLTWSCESFSFTTRTREIHQLCWQLVSGKGGQKAPSAVS